MLPPPKNLEPMLAPLKVLIVDDEPYMRKVIRTLLLSIGIKQVTEAGDGVQGLEEIRTAAPDIVLLDWQMPGMNGNAFVRHVRSPKTFPLPGVPIIMLTGKAERKHVVEAVLLGVNEYLLKPVSSQALLTRIVAVVAKPRPIVQIGDYYGPEPRKMNTYKPESDAGYGFTMLG
jgi:two-component system chemotaxis response regulator CheY